MTKTKAILTSIAVIATMATAVPSLAQSSAAEMLEQARERAREIEELKAVLNGPDQNMRLAVFDIMANSGDEATRQIALDAGLASADSLMQSMAFKETIMSMDRLVLTVEPVSRQPQAGQDAAQAWIVKYGNTFTMAMPKKDKAAGKFWAAGNQLGQVNGIVITFKYLYHTGTLTLQDDATIAGEITLYHSGYGKFTATSRIR